MSFRWSTIAVAGSLPRKNASRAEVEGLLTFVEVSDRGDIERSRPSPYLPAAHQGVDIRPRPLWLVEPDPEATVLDRERPYLRSSAAAVAAARKEWANVMIAGRVEVDYLYATSISVEPFRLGAVVLVVLPARVNDDGTMTVLQQAEVLARADVGMSQWLVDCDVAYSAVLENAERKKAMSVVSYLNTQRKLSRHRPRAARVVWGKGGSNVRAAVLPERVDAVAGLPVKGFVVDLNQYTVNCASWDEAHYLCATLNTDLVNNAIKSSQTVGVQGERDIHRRPLEQVPVPRFDATDERHVELARLSRRAHGIATEIEVQATRARAAYYAGLVEVMPRIETITAEIVAGC